MKTSEILKDVSDFVNIIKSKINDVDIRIMIGNEYGIFLEKQIEKTNNY